MTAAALRPVTTPLLATVVLLQTLAANFFLVDLIADVAREGWQAHSIVEGAAAAALVAGVVMGVLLLRAMLARQNRDAATLAVARGALADVIAQRFRQWQLTPAEADVAMFALKGFDSAEIAALRGAASGTVRAQLTRIYAKAGVTSHVALLATFFDNLIEAPDRSATDHKDSAP